MILALTVVVLLTVLLYHLWCVLASEPRLLRRAGVEQQLQSTLLTENPDWCYILGVSSLVFQSLVCDHHDHCSVMYRMLHYCHVSCSLSYTSSKGRAGNGSKNVQPWQTTYYADCCCACKAKYRVSLVCVWVAGRELVVNWGRCAQLAGV